MTKSGKHCGKRGNCTFCAISPFVTMFSKKLSAAEASESVYMRERVKLFGKTNNRILMFHRTLNLSDIISS